MAEDLREVAEIRQKTADARAVRLLWEYVRDHQEAAPRRRWAVTEPDGIGWVSSFTPPATWAEVLGRYVPGTEAVPAEDPVIGTDLPGGVKARVGEWLDRIGETCLTTRREALDLARSRPDIAQGYRNLARPPKRAGGRR